MKAKDIKVGEDYAYGSDKPGAFHRPKRVTVIEAGVYGKARSIWGSSRYPSYSKSYARVRWAGDQRGDSFTVPLTMVLRPWSEQEPIETARQAERKAAENARNDRVARIEAIAVCLKEHGVEIVRSINTSGVSLTIEDAERLVNLLH